MKRILTDWLAELKRRLPLGDYLELGPYASNSIRCPFPDHEDRTPSFVLYGDRWHCFGAGHNGRCSGDVIDLIQAREGVDFATAIRKAAEQVGMKPPQLGREISDGELESRRRAAALHRFYDLFLTFCWATLDTHMPDPLFRLSAVLNDAQRIAVREVATAETDSIQHAIKLVETYGWSVDTVAAWRVGYCPKDGRYLIRFLDASEEGRGLLDEYPSLPVLVGIFYQRKDGRKFPWFGGRLTMSYGIEPYMAARKIPEVVPLSLDSSKYAKPVGHSEKHPSVWEEVRQPLLVSPPKLDDVGNVLLPCPWDTAGDVIVAEGLPDAISAWEVGNPVVSPVAIHAAKGLQADQLERVAGYCAKNGARLVSIFDSELTGNGTRGLVRTMTPLVEKGYPLFVGTLPLETQNEELTKLDINEYCRERGHEPGILDEVLARAIPLDSFLLEHVPADTTPADLLHAFRHVALPGKVSGRRYDLTAITSLRKWDRHLRDLVQRRFRLEEAAPLLEELDELISAAFLRKLEKDGAKSVPLDDLEVYRALAHLEMNDAGFATAISVLFGDRLRFRRTDKSWYLWAGHSWMKAPGSQAERYMFRAIRGLEEAVAVFEAVETAAKANKKQHQTKNKTGGEKR